MRITRFTSLFCLWVSFVLAGACACGVSQEAAQIGRIFINDPVRVLGYDPDTDPIVEAQTGGTVVLCMHGFGDSKHSSNALSPHTTHSALLPDKVRKALVSFNFRDHRDASGVPIARLRFTNLGGEPDARVVLFHIIKCFCAGYTNIVLFGHSRGCAATIRALDMFVHPYNYRQVWEDFGFGTCCKSLDCESIQTIYRALGRIYLARPLLDVKNAIWMAGRKATGSFLAPVTAAMLRCVACTFASYSMRAAEPIDILKVISLEAHFDFYIFFAPHDVVVGNIHDDTVINELAHNPANRSNVCAYCTGNTHFEFYDAVAAMGAYLASVV